MEFQYCYLVHSDDELYHHGVKGMHWGIRRYQNKDGSLTPKGKAKLDKYKKKQVARVSESYAKAKDNMAYHLSFLQKKKEKKLKKGKDVTKVNEKILKYQNESKKLNAESVAAIKKAKSMKLSDIDNAKRQVAAKHAKRALAAMGAAAIAGVTDFGIAAALGASTANAASIGGASGAMAVLNAGGSGFKPSFTNLTRKERKAARSSVKLSTKVSNPKKPKGMNVERDNLGRVTSVGGKVEIGPNGKVGMYDSKGNFTSLSNLHSNLASGNYNKPMITVRQFNSDKEMNDYYKKKGYKIKTYR